MATMSSANGWSVWHANDGQAVIERYGKWCWSAFVAGVGTWTGRSRTKREAERAARSSLRQLRQPEEHR